MTEIPEISMTRAMTEIADILINTTDMTDTLTTSHYWKCSHFKDKHTTVIADILTTSESMKLFTDNHRLHVCVEIILICS